MQVQELLQDLTEAQRRAVTHTEGPLLVLAGAGSGKTRVITRRAAYLAATVTRPSHILAITFTNKAATEMRERIASLGLHGMTVATFHSLCARLLRQYADQVGLKYNFSIYDESDRNEVIRKAVTACGLAIDQWPARAGCLCHQPRQEPHADASRVRPTEHPRLQRPDDQPYLDPLRCPDARAQRRRLRRPAVTDGPDAQG